MMLKALKGLLGLAQREDATTGELAPSLPAAEAELAAARAAQAEAEEAYRASLLTSDEARLRQLDAARREAGVRIDRAEILVQVLKDRFVAAQEREDEAERVGRYEAAKRQADDAAAALSEMYPALAGGIVDLLEGIARAEAEVRAVNLDLPRGCERIPAVEGRVRDAPSHAEEIIEESTVRRWVEVGRHMPGNFDQDAARATVGARGIVKLRGFPNGDGRQVEARAFSEQRFLPAISGERASCLALGVKLPGLRHGDAAFFTPVERDVNGLFEPKDVLARIGKLRGSGLRREPVRSADVRLVPHDDTPVSAPPVPEAFRSFTGRFPAREAASGRFPSDQG